MKERCYNIAYRENVTRLSMRDILQTVAHPVVYLKEAKAVLVDHKLTKIIEDKSPYLDKHISRLFQERGAKGYLYVTKRLPNAIYI